MRAPPGPGHVDNLFVEGKGRGAGEGQQGRPGQDAAAGGPRCSTVRGPSALGVGTPGSFTQLPGLSRRAPGQRGAARASGCPDSVLDMEAPPQAGDRGVTTSLGAEVHAQEVALGPPEQRQVESPNPAAGQLRGQGSPCTQRTGGRLASLEDGKAFCTNNDDTTAFATCPHGSAGHM